MSQELEAVEGVVEADVSFDEKRADVRYRPELVSPEKLIEAVDGTGFKARLLEPDEVGIEAVAKEQTAP